VQRRVRVRVSGALACFSRPEMKVERVTYEVMTPSAARGVLDAVLWKPEMRWVIHKIEVLAPVRFLSMRRNELQDKVPERTVRSWMAEPGRYEPQAAGAGSEAGTPRGTLALRDVAYVIEASPHVYQVSQENNPEKYAAMLERRVYQGQCFHRPYLGCREFACDFEPAREGELPIGESRDLGLMLYDIAFGKENKAIFFRARLQDGVLLTSPAEALEPAQREEVLACSSKP
jgi:CRISPR-associated protein Cas5d